VRDVLRQKQLCTGCRHVDEAEDRGGLHNSSDLHTICSFIQGTDRLSAHRAGTSKTVPTPAGQNKPLTRKDQNAERWTAGPVMSPKLHLALDIFADALRVENQGRLYMSGVFGEVDAAETGAAAAAAFDFTLQLQQEPHAPKHTCQVHSHRVCSLSFIASAHA